MVDVVLVVLDTVALVYVMRGAFKRRHLPAEAPLDNTPLSAVSRLLGSLFWKDPDTRHPGHRLPSPATGGCLRLEDAAPDEDDNNPKA
ncbi:hypothetical protein [Streptomyces sp. NBC_00388]|uniref:hypothetical protein n=1 Tax=Streptomyces sp. NBC_00388 TaxID=2975735 RepID=UPI002E1A4D52